MTSRTTSYAPVAIAATSYDAHRPEYPLATHPGPSPRVRSQGDAEALVAGRGVGRARRTGGDPVAVAVRRVAQVRAAPDDAGAGVDRVRDRPRGGRPLPDVAGDVEQPE